MESVLCMSSCIDGLCGAVVDGATHKAGLQLSIHLIITCYTVEWMYTYVCTYCRCVPMRLTGRNTSTVCTV